jgi:hypothetical protein
VEFFDELIPEQTDPPSLELVYEELEELSYKAVS